MGHDETGCEYIYIKSAPSLLISRLSFLLAGTNAPKSPRGVPGFQLNNGTFGAWKVQGKVGGYTESAKPCSSTFLRF